MVAPFSVASTDHGMEALWSIRAEVQQHERKVVAFLFVSSMLYPVHFVGFLLCYLFIRCIKERLRKGIEQALHIASQACTSGALKFQDSS